MDDARKMIERLSVCCNQKPLEEKKTKKDEKLSMYRYSSLMTVPVESGVLATAHGMGRERRMRLLHEPFRIVVGTLQKYSLNGLIKKQSVSRVRVRTNTSIVLL